eukprot:TRINITY_DN330_c0_g2_i4.p2 TRINITY_DN330_c0_g2~~TRINITY_DN330_c0_g2_i4.p2  ORF type:complete len:210 (+),score=-33.49 TRINITY_DN330_c0_g2_i4:377-1006(+)
MGSFRPTAGNGYLHPQYNFTRLAVKTALKSLRHSCRSELTRQGISLPQDRYSYGRRLPRLRFRASRQANPSPQQIGTGQVSVPIRRLTTWQRPVFLVNSRQGLFTAASFSSTSKWLHLLLAPLLPKLRGHFAQFLYQGSLERLRILSSPTCVGLRYGLAELSLEVFLGSMIRFSWLARRLVSPSDLGVKKVRICLNLPPTSLDTHPSVC